MNALPEVYENSKCPSCLNGKMTLKSSKYGEFFGCNRFPHCAYSRKIKQSTSELEIEANRLLGENPID